MKKFKELSFEEQKDFAKTSKSVSKLISIILDDDISEEIRCYALFTLVSLGKHSIRVEWALNNIINAAGREYPNEMRCEAAYGLRNEETKRRTITGYIIDAGSEWTSSRVRIFAEHYPQWLYFVTTRKDLFYAISGLRREEETIIPQIIKQIEDREILKSVFCGSRFHYEDIDAKCHFTKAEFRTLLKYYPKEDWIRPSQEYLFSKLDQGDRQFLLECVRNGFPAAVNRIVELWPEDYAEQYIEKASPRVFEKIIGKKILSDDALKGLLRRWRDFNDYPDTIIQAVKQINDYAFLYGILCDAYNYEKLRNAVLDQLKDTRYIADYLIDHPTDSEILESKKYIFEMITDPGELFRVACSISYYKKYAAEKLTDDYLFDLAGNVDYTGFETIEYAVERVASVEISEADDRQLLLLLQYNVMSITQGEGREVKKNNIGKIVSALQSGQAIETALKIMAKYHGYLIAPVWESSAERCYGEIVILIERFGNRRRLAELMLQYPDIWTHIVAFDKNDNIIRSYVPFMKEKIKGTEEEQWFLSQAPSYFFTQPVGMINMERLLADYDGITTAQAAWRYGGEKYISYLTEEIKKEHEIRTIESIGKKILDIYKNISEAADMLEPFIGKKYGGHYDYVSDRCPNDNESYTKYYRLE